MKHTKVLALLLISLLAPPHSQAQNHHLRADSVAFVNAVWQTDTLDGFLYRRYHFQHHQIFNSNQYLCVIEIPKGSPTRLRFVSDTVMATVADFAQRADALAAINGSFFNMSTGAPVCYLRIDGKELGDNEPSRTDSVNRKYYQNAAIRLLTSGRPRFNIPTATASAKRKCPTATL